MANRHSLHRSQLDDFREWLVQDGWVHDRSQVYPAYQVVRAQKRNNLDRWIIVYDRMEGDHLTLLDCDIPVFKAYLRARAEPKPEVTTITMQAGNGFPKRTFRVFDVAGERYVNIEAFEALQLRFEAMKEELGELLRKLTTRAEQP